MSACEVFTNPLGSKNKVFCIAIVFLYARSYRKNIRIEDNISGFYARLLGEKIISACSNLNLSIIACCLSFFVKAHHNNRSAKTFYVMGASQKDVLTFL